MTTIASLIALAIGGVLVRFSLETKVFTILAVALVALFVGLFAPSLINSWLLAARLGIAGVVALWLVVWLLHVRRTRPSRPSLARRNVTARVAPGADPGSSFERTTNEPPASESSPDGQEPTDPEADDDKPAATDSADSAAASDDAPVTDEPEDKTGKPEGGSDE